MKWLISLLLFPISSFAFTLGGANNSLMRGWNTDSLIFHINAQDCQVTEEILKRATQEAIDLWNSVPGTSISLKLGDATTTTVAVAAETTTSGEPVILCDTGFGSSTGLDPNYSSGWGGFALVGDTIAYGYILLNAQGTSASINQLTYRILTIIIAHEIGHVLGLGHSEDPNALMYYDISRRTQLSLGQDDMDGLTYLYPRHEPSDPIFGCGTLTTPPSGPGNSGLLLNILGLGIFVLLISQKFRRIRFRL